MQLPRITPIEENIVCTKKDEISELVRNTLSNQEFSGVFLKIFAKDDTEKYYVTLLMDKRKLLASKVSLLSSKTEVIGDESLKILKRIINYPLVIDVYGLDEIELKISITDNLDIYNATPKIEIDKIFEETIVENKELAEKERILEEALKKKEVKKKEIEPESNLPSTVEQKVAPKKEKPSKKESKPKKRTKTLKPEITVEIIGGEIFKPILKEYTEEVLKEVQTLNGVSPQKIKITGEVGSGVIYLHVEFYGISEGEPNTRQMSERRVLYFINKHLPIIWRKAGLKPILSGARAKITGPGESFEEEKETLESKKKIAPRKIESNISVEAHESIKPYFSTYARAILQDIQNAGIDVEKMHLDIKGRSEHEINLTLWGKAPGKTHSQARSIVESILKTHAKEISRALNKYITVHRVQINLEETEGEVSESVKQILSKKEELEKEIEKLLKEVGVDELSSLTEEKRREIEENLIKPKVEPAIEALRRRLQNMFKDLPNSVFRWMRLDWELHRNEVLITLEASFDKRGSLIGVVSDDRIIEDATQVLNTAVQEISKEHNVPIKIKNVNINVR
ncbi:hypothetical protein K1720_08095 [Thermococcus argininiproducens]|uniref:DUF2226 domain-containing protein n=1 Tax=Thermococcus argininiproducens TaxID=2866384 RepID=A0A9E7M990_9EURY|nr:hypothetical protein [Thermococcus argininiproducens]USG99473.1 hypothetical protein K1720_08095 [Thermococcus argininiproducens]